MYTYSGVFNVLLCNKYTVCILSYAVMKFLDIRECEYVAYNLI